MRSFMRCRLTLLIATFLGTPFIALNVATAQVRAKGQPQGGDGRGTYLETQGRHSV